MKRNKQRRRPITGKRRFRHSGMKLELEGKVLRTHAIVAHPHDVIAVDNHQTLFLETRNALLVEMVPVGPSLTGNAPDRYDAFRDRDNSVAFSENGEKKFFVTIIKSLSLDK